MGDERQSNGVDYDSVLTDLVARRDQLNAAIAAIQAITGGSSLPLPGVPSPAQPTPSPGGVVQIRQDDFFNMTILDAAKKYLGMMKRPQNARTITDALIQGGYLFTAANPMTTVAAILSRATDGGGISRVSKGTFGLSEWYPNRGRSA